MTEKNDTTETTEDTTEVQEQAQEPTGAAQKPQEGQEQPEATGNQEAAKYRRRLRETEAERDALTTRLEALQRTMVEQYAADQIEKPAGLWAHAQLADLLDDDGNVDRQKVIDASKTAREELGLSKARFGPYAPLQGKMTTLEQDQKSFADAFAPGRD